MKLLTKENEIKMRRNWDESQEKCCDHAPVVKLFYPGGAATWLLSELSDDGDTAFGLCDIGHGEAELGYVSIGELAEFRGRLGLQIERDLYFHPSKTLSEYAAEAKKAGYIIA